MTTGLGGTARGRLARSLLLTTSLTTAAALAAQAAQAQSTETIVVTAQKREENIQDVPISLIALGDQTLRELEVTNFADYAKFLPTVTFQSTGSSSSTVYMRGVVSGGDGNHSASLPSVGIYLDEQPVTTINGFPPLHIYDIQRVEALAGPQGTLYGASSQSGTLRIITNKPDSSGFSARYDAEVNSVSDGDVGYQAEGFVNQPLGDRAAIRLVGYYVKEAGYIDNVLGSRTFPTSGITSTNEDLVKEDFNDVETIGGRAALRIDLNDNWSVTPSILGQIQHANGVFAFDPQVGDLQVNRFRDDYSDDTFGQAALTLEGRIGDFDLTYAGAAMRRKIESQYDYTDYAYYYDVIAGYGAYFYDDNYILIDPTQYYNGEDNFWKYSNELRISTPQDLRVRGVFGVFANYQRHDIRQRYVVDGMGDLFAVTGWDDTIWLTKQRRIDQDYAVFGEVSFDITDRLTATGGLRLYKYDNWLGGFFGYNATFSSRTGEAVCSGPAIVGGSPCTNLDNPIEDEGETHKLNLTYDLTDDTMVYATYATGFRPGGANRKGTLPPYLADELVSYEIGAKTTLADGRLTLNGAAFLQEWEDFQFPILGQNGLTEIKNANQAEITGFEGDATFQPIDGLTFTGAIALINAELTADYCGYAAPSGQPATVCPLPADDPSTPDVDETDPPEAPSGQPLPVVPDVKATFTARYEFSLASYMAHVQGSVSGQTDSPSSLLVLDQDILGDQEGFWVTDLSVGLERDNWELTAYLSNAFDERADLFNFVACAIETCGTRAYVGTNQPRTFGIRFGQSF